MANLKSRDEGPANNVFPLNLDRTRLPRVALTVRELAEVRQMLADYREMRDQFEMIKTACPIARNIFQTGAD